MCKHPESDFIKEHIEAIKEANHFFSNDCKSDREVWVVSNFLSQLCIEFSNEEIKPSSVEPVDVVYCNAKFQVKEICDKGRKRGDEYKESLRKAETATSTSDFLEPYSPQKITCGDVVPFVAKWASMWQRKYGPSECMSTDILFYFNLQDIHVVGNGLTDIDAYSSKMAAWRSVSVFLGDCAFVLHVSEKAPSFLKTAKGKVHRKMTRVNSGGSATQNYRLFS
jgi:hypothetical protein